MRARIVSLAALMAALSLGCAAGSGVADPPPPSAPTAPTPKGNVAPEYATVGDFCEARAKAECSDAVVSGCDLAGKSACESARTKSCLASVPQGTKYQSSRAEACLDAVTTTFSSAQITAESLASADDACGPRLFAGPGEARAQCMTDYDCDSSKNLSCVIPFPPPESGAGQCFVPTFVEPGGDCSGQGAACTTGNYCAPMGQTCVIDAQEGQSCNPDYIPCGAGLTCSDGGPFATCGAGGANGAACNAPTDCTSGLCDKASDQADGTCASSITLSSLDSMCASFE
jgi:hypothetical protein